MPTSLAQVLNLPGNNTINGPIDSGRFPNLASLVNNAIPLVFAVAGIFLFLYLVWGGFDFLTSMGDPKRAESGKGKITSAIVGFVIIFVAYWLVQVVDFIFKLGVYTPTAP